MLRSRVLTVLIVMSILTVTMPVLEPETLAPEATATVSTPPDLSVEKALLGERTPDSHFAVGVANVGAGVELAGTAIGDTGVKPAQLVHARGFDGAAWSWTGTDPAVTLDGGYLIGDGGDGDFGIRTRNIRITENYGGDPTKTYTRIEFMTPTKIHQYDHLGYGANCVADDGENLLQTWRSATPGVWYWAGLTCMYSRLPTFLWYEPGRGNWSYPVENRQLVILTRMDPDNPGVTQFKLVSKATCVTPGGARSNEYANSVSYDPHTAPPRCLR